MRVRGLRPALADLEPLSSPHARIGLATLPVLEIGLGIDTSLGTRQLLQR